MEWRCLDKAGDTLAASLGEGNCDTGNAIECVVMTGGGATHTQTIETGVNGNDDGIIDPHMGSVRMPQVSGVGFFYPSSPTSSPACLFSLNIFNEFRQLAIGQISKRKGVRVIRVGTIHVYYFLSFHLLYQHYITEV